MSQQLVPELHDIGKLVDWDALLTKEQRRNQRHGHDPSAAEHMGITLPSTATWQGAVLHHLNRKSRLDSRPKELEAMPLPEAALIWLLSAADHLASSVSRSLHEGFESEQLGMAKRDRIAGGSRDVIKTLWADTGPVGSTRISRVESLRHLAEFLASDPTWPAAKACYGDALARIPEDKGFPRHVTSLLTHCELVGKFYRILERSSRLDMAKRALVYNGIEARTVEEVESRWQFRLLKVAIRFAQRPVRTRDLGVFALLNDGLEQIANDSAVCDHLLLNTLDTMWLFLPLDTPLEEVVRPLLERGFWVGADEASVPLNIMDANFERMKGCVAKKTAYLPNLPAEIKPPICELCQMAPAEGNPVVDTDSQIEERLCSTCRSIREDFGGQPLFDLGHEWEEENAPVAWVRVRLDYNALEGTLSELFRDYVSAETKRSGTGDGMTDQERDNIVQNLRSVALSVDFTNDYLLFLRGFIAALEDWHRCDDHVQAVTTGHPELMLVRIDSGEDVLAIAGLFATRMNELFPKCTVKSPIKLGISVSNAKYPFLEHWRYLEKPREAINLRMVGRGLPLEFTIPRFQNLMDSSLGEERASSALHRAAAIEARSHSAILAEVELLDNLPKGSGLHRALLQGFSVSQLLSYHNLATWR
ncbi:MAG: hypothetical protein M0T85_01025 [Dehalococcoidales bacterium]|nr:hypothetical protein [Dehalococcoidales bacterium]